MSNFDIFSSDAGIPVLDTQNRSGHIDIFKTDVNSNVTLVGDSGIGKSVFVDATALSQLLRSEHLIIIDYGHSHARLADATGGKVIALNPDNPISLNPFGGFHNEAALNSSKRILESFIATKVSPSDASRDLILRAEGCAYSAIHEAWKEKGADLDFSSLIECAKRNPDFKDLSDALSNVQSEFHDSWMNGPAVPLFDMDGDPKLTVIEMEGLSPYADLTSLAINLVLIQILRSTEKSSTRKRPLVVIDEAWTLFNRSPFDIQHFMQAFMRQLRMTGGGLMTVFQSETDLLNPKMEVFLNESTWRVSMKRPQAGDKMPEGVMNADFRFSSGDFDQLLRVVSPDQHPLLASS